MGWGLGNGISECVWGRGYTVVSIKNMGEYIIVGRVHFTDWERIHSLVNVCFLSFYWGGLKYIIICLQVGECGRMCNIDQFVFVEHGGQIEGMRLYFSTIKFISNVFGFGAVLVKHCVFHLHYCEELLFHVHILERIVQ